MQCKVDGCGRNAQYKAACLCQKHYFRQRRYGTTELTRKPARPRIEMSGGYQYVHAPDHPLTPVGQAYVAEHRVVLHSAIGDAPMSCALCGVRLTWATCHVDHIDENIRNNVLENLRPTCMRCNVWRSMPPAASRSRGAVSLTYMGETKTAHEWSRDPKVKVSGTTIRHRKAQGMTDEEALFAPKATHKSTISKKPSPAKWAKANALAKQPNPAFTTEDRQA